MKHPYTEEQMEKFLYYCNIMPHDIRQDLEFYQPCRDCQNDNPQCFDYCGIDRFLQEGSGFVSVQENELLYDIKGAPDQIDSDTWIVIASCDAARDTVDDRDWCLIFNKEDRRWHNYGLIRLFDEDCCPDCDCCYVHEHDKTESSTPYECFQCGLRFSF